MEHGVVEERPSEHERRQWYGGDVEGDVDEPGAPEQAVELRTDSRVGNQVEEVLAQVELARFGVFAHREQVARVVGVDNEYPAPEDVRLGAAFQCRDGFVAGGGAREVAELVVGNAPARRCARCRC